MWIRTTSGLLYKLGKHYDKTKTENVYYQNGKGLLLHTISDDNIKKQGDNLIDVLEVNDMVYDRLGFPYFIERIKDGEIFYRNGLLLINIKQVITHEQYMPLAQEVKC